MEPYDEAFWTALGHNDVEIIRVLLPRQTDIGSERLYVAVENCHVSIVQAV